MKVFFCTMVIILFGFISTAGAQTILEEEGSRFPNELPNLALYRDAKWKSIEPYRSTKEDVERLLGEPIPLFSESLSAWTLGYDDDPEWRLIVTYVGEGGSLPKSLIGHVLNIRLEPKQRRSLKGVDFPGVFLKGYLRDNVRNVECFTYDDRYGLHYSVYAKDSPNGRIHKADLQVVVYGASDKTEEYYSSP